MRLDRSGCHSDSRMNYRTISSFFATWTRLNGFSRNRYAATRNIQRSEFFACLVSLFRRISLLLFLPWSLPVFQLPLHREARHRRRQGRRFAPVQASLLAAMPDVYLRVPHFPFTTTEELLMEA